MDDGEVYNDRMTVCSRHMSHKDVLLDMIICSSISGFKRLNRKPFFL